MPISDRLTFEVDKDRLAVRLLLAPAGGEAADGPQASWLPALAEVEAVLRGHGVQGEIDRGALRSAISVAAFGTAAEVVAVRGEPPEHGQDGYVELLVDSADAPWPGPDGGGVIDFKDSRLIRNVAEGTPLALIHPPTPGRDGLDVYGRPLPARAGKALDPKLGANTRRAAQDKSLIVAATSGHLRIVGGLPEVQECYVVPGDVDYSSGNVAFGKSVQVRGDVKSGFSVEAGGDVEILGLAEDCRINAQGKLLLRGGFTGGGRGSAAARGEIRLGYVRNQEVRGESDVLVAGEAVNARLQSRRRIAVDGLVAGGCLQARHVVECSVAGTEKGAPTHLEAGYDHGLAEKMADLRAQMEKVGRHARKLDDGLRQVQDLEKLNRGLERWVIELVFDMEKMRSKVEAKLSQLSEKFAILERQAALPADARVTVHRHVHAGTVVRIGKDTHRVEQALQGPKTFRVREGRIRVEDA